MSFKSNSKKENVKVIIIENQIKELFHLAIVMNPQLFQIQVYDIRFRT